MRGDIVGLKAIARAMGIPDSRARQLLERGDINRQWLTDGVFVVSAADLAAWLETPQASLERSIAQGATQP